MHRVIQDRLEQVLAGTADAPAAAHLAQCAECREEVSAMGRQASMLRSLRARESESLAPRAGFYARVMERIEAQRPISIWPLFFESSFGRRLALASMALAFVFGFYLVSSEHYAPPVASGDPQVLISNAGLPDKETVLVNLVTYREQ
ncbi:MAG TPA: hypothetical protein VMT15_12230 [Bryobacteraceae bacterium]|nr:hypothetical protein [Bryobacteraceae bacterium]